MKENQDRENALLAFNKLDEKERRRRAFFAAREASKLPQARSDPFFLKRVYSHIYHGVAGNLTEALGT